MINIPSYIKDPSYRYQMPALQIKVEGKGNGIRTKLVNLFEVSRHLGVPPEYALRYFGAEFGAIIEYKESEQKAMLNGEFRREDLQNSMDHFIEKFVLCPVCKYPEIRIRIKKKELFSDCKACGKVRPMDMTQKISNFILKFPPKISSKEMPSSSSNVPNGKKTGKKSKKKDKNEVIMTLKSPEVIESLERLQAEPSNRVADVLCNLSVSHDFDMDIRAYLIFKGIFGINLFTLLQDPVMINMLKSNSTGCSEDMLMAFALVYGLDENYYSKISSAMFHFYNNDILSEEVFENWVNDTLDFNESSPIYNKLALDTLKSNSQQFLEWLKNAEEEEGNNEEEANEEEKKEEILSSNDDKISNEDHKENPLDNTGKGNGNGIENIVGKESLDNHQEKLESKKETDDKDLMSQLKAVEEFNIDDI